MSPKPSRARLVASIAADTIAGLKRALGRVPDAADLVEIRVDGTDLDAIDPARALGELRAATPHELILTCRSSAEGGAFHGTERDRLALLERAALSGFDYVDVEVDALEAPFPKGKAKLILSHHDFEAMPQSPGAILDRAVALGADVVKLAARVASLSDTLRLAALEGRARAGGVAFAPVPLGPSGTSGRILATKLRSHFTYAPLSASRSTGPGQVALGELDALYRFRSIGETTAIYGIVGAAALASRSPSMHNAFFARTGQDAVYVPFQEDDLAAFVEAARRLGIAGLSVTNPFKESIVPLLDAVDPEAARIGAVNTVVVRDGAWTGYNTDHLGVREPLEAIGSFEGKRALVLGAGGAARAAVHALVGMKASVRVLARSPERATALARAFGVTAGGLEEGVGEADVVVNATPVDPGLTPAAGSVAFDMVTSPEETKFLERSRKAGARVVTGLEMLAAQAVHQAKLWTGGAPSLDEMLVSARGAARSRYSRQALFAEIGEDGQRRIRRSSVLVVGAGALGSITAEMLVRAGVGRLRLVDRDYVDTSNLQRQSLYDESDVADGLPKAVAAERKLRRINSEVAIEARVDDVNPGNVEALFEGIDLVLDGTDNFETRYLLNDAAVRNAVPWIYAACVGSYGLSFVIRPGKGPCLRCFLEEVPAPGTSPTCDTAGVIAPAVHAIAAFQVTEALKLLAGREDALTGSLYSIDVWQGSLSDFRPAEKRPDCPACGEHVFSFLDGDAAAQAVTLCGRNAVQIRPASPRELPLTELAGELGKLGEVAVTVNDFLLRANLAGRELVVFADGRAIVHGTDDPKEARTLYARYVGS